MRAESARILDLHAAVGFTFQSSKHTQGVVVLFSQEKQTADPFLISVLEASGDQLGLYLERVEIETALQASEERYRRLVATLHDGVVLQRADGTITTSNTRAEEILGLSADQLQGRTSIDKRWRAIQTDGSDFPGETHPAMVALQTGQPVTDVTMGVYKPDGDLTWILINSEPLFEGVETTASATTGCRKPS